MYFVSLLTYCVPSSYSQSRRVLLLLRCSPYSTNSNSIPKPPLLPILSTQADMLLARNWIASFSLIDPSDLPKDALEISYSRSSGPGGQNVNKLSTKATVRLSLAKSTTFLPGYTISNLLSSPYYTSSTSSTSNSPLASSSSSKLTGAILLSSSIHRTQPQNLSDALSKLKKIILSSASVGLVGETSQLQKSRVEGLEKKEKKKMELVKKGRKVIKSGRRAGGGGSYD